MEDEAAMLNEDLDDLEEVDTQADDEPDTDDEFEYDEDGNIIIPDVIFDEGEDDYLEEYSEDGDESDGEDEEPKEKSDEDADEGGEDGAEGEEKLKDEEAPAAEETPASEASEPAERKALAELQAKHDRLLARAKEALAKMGIEAEDTEEGLASIAAEAEGISTKEYLDKKKAEEQEAKAQQIRRQLAFEKMAQADIAELHTAYPETKRYKDVRDMPRDMLIKFGRARDAGFSAKEAYAAANPDGIRSDVATAVKKQSLHESKSHLRSTVPKGSKDDSITMSKADLTYWRDIFPGKSDKEIQALYKKTAN